MAPTHQTLIAACCAAITAALLGAAPALADPEAPAPPPPGPPAEFVPQQSGIGNVLAQNGSQTNGPLGLPDLSAYGLNVLLGQNPAPVAPTAPGETAPATTPAVPNLSAFNPEYLLAQNQAPAAPGEGDAAPGLGPDADSPGIGRIAFLRRIYEMYGAGGLKGALLGQQSPEEFADQPVTAPQPAG